MPTEPDHIAAPVEPVYDFFKDVPALNLPIVRSRRGPVVYPDPSGWTFKFYQTRRGFRRWFNAWWWPARIRALETQLRSYEDWD